MVGLDTLLYIIIGAVAALGLLIIFIVLRNERAQSELESRIGGLTEMTNAAHLQVHQRMLDQERALAETLERVTVRVGQSLESSSTQTQETLAQLRERLAVMDTAQANITELSNQMVGLQDILSNKQARGAFGEIQLQDLVEAILPPNAFEFQATLSNGRRPDCLLRLPNPPGSIAIDAKFPLESYNLMLAAENDADKVQARRAFDRDIRKHVQDISERYILTGETAEAALMFIPSEAVYAELHARFPGAVEQSFRQRVFIVSPTTLWATLNTVRAVFKDVRMREQASIIQREVHILMEDVDRLGNRVNNLSNHFRQANKDIDEIQTSTRKITSRGERIEALDLQDEANEAAVLPTWPPSGSSQEGKPPGDTAGGRDAPGPKRSGAKRQDSQAGTSAVKAQASVAPNPSGSAIGPRPTGGPAGKQSGNPSARPPSRPPSGPPNEPRQAAK